MPLFLDAVNFRTFYKEEIILRPLNILRYWDVILCIYPNKLWKIWPYLFYKRKYRISSHDPRRSLSLLATCEAENKVNHKEFSVTFRGNFQVICLIKEFIEVDFLEIAIKEHWHFISNHHEKKKIECHYHFSTITFEIGKIVPGITFYKQIHKQANIF